MNSIVQPALTLLQRCPKEFMFDESTYLTRDDLIKERSTRQFCEWTERKLTEWASLKKSRPDGRQLHERILMRKGLFGPFHEEVLPFCRYLQASKQVSDSRRCAIHFDSALHFDATLIDEPRQTRFEITQAIEDLHHVRMEKLLSDGRVNALAAMTISGTKKTGRMVAIDEEMVGHDEVLLNLTSLAIRRMERKTDQSTANQDYDPETRLLITVDDYIIDDEDHDTLHESFVGTSLNRQSTFASVIVIGIAGHLLLEYPRKS